VIGALGAAAGYAIYFGLLAGAASVIRTQTGVVIEVCTGSRCWPTARWR